MKQSIRKELIAHLRMIIEDRELTDFEEIHYHAFNENYYITYRSEALEWLDRHEVDAFEAIADIIEWERETLGEVSLQPECINPEHIVNLYVYIKGEELLQEFDLDVSQDELIKQLEDALNQ